MTTVDLPLPIVVTRYQCPHCRRTRSKQAAAAAHITRCWQNPATRGCKTCVHLAPPEDGPYSEHPGWDEECDEGCDISGGLTTGCPQWAPAP